MAADCDDADSDFRDRYCAWLANAIRAWREWFESLSDKEQAFLLRNKISDFESRLDSQTLVLSEDGEDPVAVLEIKAEQARHPNGPRDWEREFFEVIDPAPPTTDLSAHCAQTMQDAISTIVAELLVVPISDARSALLALIVACNWGQADGLSVRAAAARAKVNRGLMFIKVTRWKKLLRPQELSQEILGALHVVFDEVMGCGNAIIALVALAIASGCAERLGYTLTELSRRCGCSRQNLSKEVRIWRERFGFSYHLGHGKSDAARARFRQAQLDRSWRREPMRQAAEIDSARERRVSGES